MRTPPLGMTEANFCAIVDPRSPNPKTETRRLSNGSDKPKYNVGDRCYLTEPTQNLAGADYTNKKLHIQYFWHSPESKWVTPTEQDLIKINNRKTGLYSKQNARFILKSFARYWVEIVDVKLERLFDITAEAAISEGIKPPVGYYWDYVNHYVNQKYNFNTAIQSYFSEIEMLHGEKIAQSNPWLWVYKFKFLGNNNE
jgi:hypothetical protein